MNNIWNVRQDLSRKLVDEKFVVDKSGGRVVELIGYSFSASDITIFGAPNAEYIEREIEWYENQSLFVADIPGKVPEIWKKVASSDGKINSNYGYLLYSRENFCQYDNVLTELINSPDSRRAIAIYTRPEIWEDYNWDGMSDFICTNTVQYLIRENMLHTIVNMRSNDVTFGYRNDRAWQDHVRRKLLADLNYNFKSNNYSLGDLIWQVGSLHVYERDFYLLHHYDMTGYYTIPKTDYRIAYPTSEWVK
jgi:thymidylate synthase